jgi:hypothetical protein
MILAIDPGLKMSGYSLIAETTPEPYLPVEFGKIENSELAGLIPCMNVQGGSMVIEKPVCSRYSGSEISETAIQCGFFAARADSSSVYLITRSKVRGKLIGRPSGGKTIDSQLISYLVERFSPEAPNRGKGTKKDPAWFYGFHSDIWQAYALGVVFIDMKNGGIKKDLDYLEDGRL